MKEGWTYKKLGEVCKIYTGKLDANAAKEDGIYPFFTCSVDVSKIDVYAYDCECVLLAGNGDLNVKYYSGKFNAYQRTYVIESKNKNILDVRFLYWFMSWYVFILRKISIGATIRYIKIGYLTEALIPLYSLSEQQEIVERLDKAFAKIDALKANAEKNVENARALFQKALSEAMSPKEGWEKKKLGELATSMYRGSGIKRDQVTKDGIPCVRYGEIYTTYNIGFEECVSHTQEEYISSPKYFEHGDLLFAITGESVEDIGKTIAYLGHEKCMLGGDIICMKHKQNPKFMAYALSTEDAIRQKGLGKTKLKVVHTNAPALKAISIHLPPLSEQQQIVEKLDGLSEKVKRYEENLRKVVAECDNLKQAILRETFE